jgi:hypothetical protein
MMELESFQKLSMEQSSVHRVPSSWIPHKKMHQKIYSHSSFQAILIVSYYDLEKLFQKPRCQIFYDFYAGGFFTFHFTLRLCRDAFSDV